MLIIAVGLVGRLLKMILGMEGLPVRQKWAYSWDVLYLREWHLFAGGFSGPLPSTDSLPSHRPSLCPPYSPTHRMALSITNQSPEVSTCHPCSPLTSTVPVVLFFGFVGIKFNDYTLLYRTNKMMNQVSTPSHLPATAHHCTTVSMPCHMSPPTTPYDRLPRTPPTPR